MEERVINSSTKEVCGLDMTQEEIVAAADALSRQTDQNHPTGTGSYQDLINSVRKGREALSRQDGYCQKKP
jgi:hypothetical protein